jgi:hypothetical protein
VGEVCVVVYENIGSRDGERNPEDGLEGVVVRRKGKVEAGRVEREGEISKW